MRQRSLTGSAREAGSRIQAACSTLRAAGDTQTSRELGNFQARQHSPGPHQYHFKGEVLNSQENSNISSKRRGAQLGLEKLTVWE